MRISFPLLHLGPSGGDRIIAELANRLKEKGHDVCLILPKGADRGLYPVKVRKIEVRRSVGLRWYDALNNLFLLFDLARATPGSDIVVATAGLTSIIVHVASKFLSKGKAVYFVQNLDFLFFERRTDFIYRFLIRSFLRFFPRIVVISERLRDDIHELTGAVPVVIHSAISDIFRPAPASRAPDPASPRLIWVGRKFKIKGLPLMLEAFNALRRHKPHAKLLIVTPDRINIAPDPGITIVAATPEELLRFYRSSDIFVSTAVYEGLGLPPLEAMACGLPVVLTNSYGVLDYAVDGVNSLIVNERRADRIADSVMRLLSDRALAERIIAAGLETAGSFHYNKMVDEFDAYFASVLL